MFQCWGLKFNNDIEYKIGRLASILNRFFQEGPLPPLPGSEKFREIDFGENRID